MWKALHVQVEILLGLRSLGRDSSAKRVELLKEVLSQDVAGRNPLGRSRPRANRRF